MSLRTKKRTPLALPGQADPGADGAEGRARRRAVSAARSAACLLLAAFVTGACASLFETAEPSEPAAEEEPFPPAPGIAYEAEMTGVEDADLRAVLEATSQLESLRDRPPPSLARLRLRVEEDLARLETALRSEGYYDARIDSRIVEDETPVKVVLDIEPGPRYTLAAYDIRYEGETPPAEDQRPDAAQLGIEPGAPARGPVVLAAEQAWSRLMQERGHPLARVIDRRVVINRETRTLSVTLRVDAGPIGRFGPVALTGLDEVAESHVRRLLPWREGEVYDSRKVEAARRALSETRLFSSVTIKPAEKVGADGALPIAINLVEGAPRTIGFGASYATDVGFGGEVFWEHRNTFGKGERLRVDITAAQIEQSATVGLRKPAFPGRKQALVFNAAFANELTDAFEARSYSAFAGMETAFAENWRLTGGLAPEYSDLKDGSVTEEFTLLGVPLTASRDVRDDLLDPTRGTRLDLSLTPYYGKAHGAAESAVSWLTASATGSVYQAIDPEARFVLASRAKLGALYGEATSDLPASKRFYAGGGGSIRGYEFQTVGPLDATGDPAGGRSILELNAEMRIRVSEDIGVVPFVDGGTVFTSPYPDFSETLHWAAGLGLRYFTGIGPIRVDFAFPLNRRDTDDVFEFYISFGQAF